MATEGGRGDERTVALEHPGASGRLPWYQRGNGLGLRRITGPPGAEPGGGIAGICSHCDRALRLYRGGGRAGGGPAVLGPIRDPPLRRRGDADRLRYLQDGGADVAS